MSKILELSSKLVMVINKNTQTILKEIGSQTVHYKDIIEKIAKLKHKINEDKTSARLDFIICKLTISDKSNCKIVKIMKSNKLFAILTDNMVKPKVEICCDTTEIDCKCMNQHIKIVFKTENIKLISNTNYFDQFVGKPMIIRLYSHYYRSFFGFTCYILMITETESFILDTLSIRNVKHKIFDCGTIKYFHCNNCYNQFVKEFCQVGCYEIMSGKDSIFCDWRIRPFNIHIENVILDDMNIIIDDYNLFFDVLKTKFRQRIIESKTNGAYMHITKKSVDIETYEYNIRHYTKNECDYEILADQFMKFFNISMENKELVLKIIKLRSFIAKNNDESVFYTMTDNQMCKLVCDKPKTKEDFLECLDRMSALAREHIFDFLMIIQKFSSLDNTDEHVGQHLSAFEESSSSNIQNHHEEVNDFNYSSSDNEEIKKGLNKK